MPELYESITAIFGLLLAGSLRYVVKRLNDAETTIKEGDIRADDDLFSDGVKNLRVSIREFNPIAKTIARACLSTKISRVLLLVCVNGDSKPERATVLWDANHEEVWTYDDVALDSDYQHRVESITKKGFIQFKTEDAKNTRIGSFYEIEGVFESIWVAIAKKASINTDQIAYIYMTASTHLDDGMGNEELRMAQNIAALVRHLVSTHGYRPI